MAVLFWSRGPRKTGSRLSPLPLFRADAPCSHSRRSHWLHRLWRRPKTSWPFSFGRAVHGKPLRALRALHTFPGRRYHLPLVARPTENRYAPFGRFTLFLAVAP